MLTVETLLAFCPDATPSGKGWKARCPAHDDGNPSFSFWDAGNGVAAFKCHAGCSTERICDEVYRHLSSSQNMSKPTPNGTQIAAEYDYRDEEGELLFQVVRLQPKGFRQRKPDVNGGWTWHVNGVRRVPFRLPELVQSDASKPVFVVEGEKDANRLGQFGLVATCNAGGAGKWTDELSALLKGRLVVVLPDNDDAGRSHAEIVANSLHGVALAVRVVELPGLAPKGDVSDWLDAGHTKEELIALVKAAKDWEPTVAQWQSVVPFDHLDLPAFPTAALPSPLREWVEAESHATQTPADLAALLSLAVCSAAMARKVVVEPRPGWSEPVNLFVAVVLESGNRKTAVFRDATKPLRERERELIHDARPEIARRKSIRRRDEEILKRLEAEAASDPNEANQRKAADLAAKLASEPQPELPRLIVADATEEVLAMLLRDNDGRIASMSPEGTAFGLMAGRYNKGTPQFDVYLQAHAGDDLVVDRVGRATVAVARPSMTCAYTVQPTVISSLTENKVFRGRGLLARFLFAWPKSWIGQRLIAPPPVDQATSDCYREMVRQLYDHFAPTAPEALPKALTLCDDARQAFVEWQTQVESMLGDAGTLEGFRDWGGKLCGATLRLAAVIHCVGDLKSTEIGVGAMQSAIDIGRYLIPHAEATLGDLAAMEALCIREARRVLAWIRRHKRRHFRRLEVQRDCRRHFPRPNDIDEALEELTRRNYIRLVPTPKSGPGRPTSDAYEVNPALFEQSP